MQRYTSNQRMLLDILRCHQPITRADVTALTDLTQQSVHRIIEGLIADGLLVTERGKPNGRGKPSPVLNLSSTACYSMGVALDVNGISISVVDFNGSLVADQKVAIASATDDHWIRSMLDACEAIFIENDISRQALCGFGVALGTAFERQCSSSLLSKLPSLLVNALDVPTFIENKAVAGAIGESLAGAGRQYKNFAFVSIDHEISGGLIADGMPFRGYSGNAGDFTYLFANRSEAEAVSLEGLLKGLQQNGVDVCDLTDLQNRFDPQWPGVSGWLEGAAERIDNLICAITGIFDPQAIVFGGQLPAVLTHMLITEVTNRFELRFSGAQRQMPILMQSLMAGDGAATGSALMPLKYLYFR